MDIMAPDLLWIDDRCYRLPVLDSENYSDVDKIDSGTGEPLHYDGPTYEEEECGDDDDDDDTCYLEDQIETLSDNRFKLCVPIPQTFLPKIIGAKGVTKKRIESDTKTILLIPKPMEHGDVVIKGSSKRGIILAKKSIDAIIASTRQKLVFTHFISVPMNGEEVMKNFIVFKDEVLKLYGKDRGVDESIFQNPNKLHLTIATLVLADQNERNLAEKLLNEVYEKHIKSLVSNHKKCMIEMKGIEYMNDDPAEVDVLYGKINVTTDQELIQKIADTVVKYFSHHKLMKSDNLEHVKLHVTVMNTLFREEDPEELNAEMDVSNKNKWNKKTRRTFNATNILQKFNDFYFGQQELKTIHLSVRFSSGKDGYYKSSCLINL